MRKLVEEHKFDDFTSGHAGRDCDHGGADSNIGALGHSQCLGIDIPATI
jgi:hypothetical protein